MKFAKKGWHLLAEKLKPNKHGERTCFYLIFCWWNQSRVSFSVILCLVISLIFIWIIQTLTLTFKLQLGDSVGWSVCLSICGIKLSMIHFNFWTFPVLYIFFWAISDLVVLGSYIFYRLLHHHPPSLLYIAIKANVFLHHCKKNTAFKF